MTMNLKRLVSLQLVVLNTLSESNDSIVCPPKKMRASAGGRKKNALEVREALFSDFVDVRENMKGRFPKRLLRLKAKQLYSEWLRENSLADQMPLHRNESSEQRTLHFKGKDIFVKEKHMLSRERITCFTTVSSSLEMNILPEFVFKDKGIQTKINSPPNMHYQWSPSGSYRLEHTLKTISHLPNRYHIFSEKDYAIYVLDNLPCI